MTRLAPWVVLSCALGGASGCALIDAVTSSDHLGTDSELPLCSSGGDDFRIVGFSVPGVVSAGALAIGDFDGDGATDLLIGSSDQVQVLYGGSNGLGQGDALAGQAANVGGGGIADMVVSDLDADGNDDAAVLLRAPPRLEIFFGRADRTFAAPVEWNDIDVQAVGTLTVGPKPALVVVGGSTGANMQMLVWETSAFTVNTSTTALTNPTALAVGDDNGDGLDDVAFVHEGGIAVQEQNGSGVFTVPQVMGIPTEGPRFQQVLLGHAGNDDQTDDYYTISEEPTGGPDRFRVARLFHSTTTGPVLLAGTSLHFGVNGLARLGDWDGDGLDDLIIPGNETTSGSNLFLLMASDNGLDCQRRMTAFVSGDIKAGAAVAVGDIDGDSKLDIAFADQSGAVMLVMGK